MKEFLKIMLLCITIQACSSVPQRPFIAANLVGYNTGDSKEAFLVNISAGAFELVNSETGAVAFEGVSTNMIPADASSGDSLSIIDFSSVDESGSYVLRSKENPEVHSHPFLIGANVYRKAMNTAIESYYYNRCGTVVDNGNPWKHSACHIDDAVYYDNPAKHRDLTGGWHDAGDYNKFSINGELSVGLLLRLYEMKPELFDDNQLQIPERNNGIPDLLDEVRWQLEWLLKMQTGTGGVYHKVSQKTWVGEFLPHEDPEVRYIFRVSSNATAGFTAVAAMGARIFKDYDREFSDQLYRATLKGWSYLLEYPVTQPLGGFKNPNDVRGGEYGDYNDKDVRLWALVELYKLTGETSYLDHFEDLYPNVIQGGMSPLSFKNFEALALTSFLNTDVPESYRSVQDHVLRQLEGHAKRIISAYRQNNYRTLLNNTEYYWGSAGVTLGYAFVLIQLYEATGNALYYRAALDQLHYILGRNPVNRSLVTGVGSHAVAQPYHQFAMLLDAGSTIPGMMVGGANYRQQLRGQKLSDYPGKSYEDNPKNYFVNEPAINWTAIFSFTAGYFSSPNHVLHTN